MTAAAPIIGPRRRVWIQWVTAALAIVATMAGTTAAVVAGWELPARGPAPALTAKAAAGLGDTMTGMDQAADVPMRARDEVERAVETLRRFAINLLLLPLVDDDLEPRWADTVQSIGCLDARPARVDGRPLVVGDPLPRAGFLLDRDLSSCRIVDSDSVDVTGSVTLHVIPDDNDGVTAVVALQGLRIRGGFGAVAALDERFAARAMQAGGPAVPALHP